MEQIKVVVKNTGKRPTEKDIDNSLESLQEIVGGYIEVTMIAKGILLVLNEEGKINGLDGNFSVMTTEGNQNQLHDLICGDCLFLSSDGEDFGSLSEEQSQFIQSKFNLDGTLFIIDRKEVGI